MEENKMRKQLKKSNMLKKVTALALSSIVLFHSTTYAEVSTNLYDSSNQKLGKCYVARATYMVDAFTESVTNGAGKYKYKTKVEAHVYLLQEGKRTTVDLANTQKAYGKYVARVNSVYGGSPIIDCKTFGVSTNHYIWKDGVVYKKSLNS